MIRSGLGTRDSYSDSAVVLLVVVVVCGWCGGVFWSNGIVALLPIPIWFLQGRMKSLFSLRRVASNLYHRGGRHHCTAKGTRFFSNGNSFVEQQLQELDSLRKSEGGSSDEIINKITHVAAVMRDAGRLEGALDLYQEAQEEIEKKYGEFHPLTFSGLASLGSCYGMMGKYDEGIPLLNRAIDGFRPIKEMYRYPCVHALSHLAILLHRSGKLEQALNYYEEAIEERKKLIESDNRPAEEGEI